MHLIQLVDLTCCKKLKILTKFPLKLHFDPPCCYLLQTIESSSYFDNMTPKQRHYCANFVKHGSVNGSHDAIRLIDLTQRAAHLAEFAVPTSVALGYHVLLPGLISIFVLHQTTGTPICYSYTIICVGVAPSACLS